MSFEAKKKIYIENLRELNKRTTIAAEQKKITLFELAQLYCQAYSGTNDILADLQQTAEHLSASDEILFLSELCRSELAPKIKEQLFIGSSEVTLAGAHSKISYVKNKYNDEAFEQFSRSVANAKPDYALSFAECCENVYDGRCEFGIFPIMNSKDGRLMSFYALLDRYDLKIRETVDIENEDSSATLTHARISRACKEEKERSQKNKRYVFEFSLISESTEFFSDLFEAASKVGAKLTCVDSLPVEYISNMQKFYFSFSLPQSSALAFRLFVAIKHPTYTPIGIYKETK